MSGMAMISFGVFAAVTACGLFLGIKGALSPAPPYMQGTGQVNRFDENLKKAA
ncbi:MAG: hypothetical protein ACE5FN_03775 [Leptospirillia bacterium]